MSCVLKHGAIKRLAKKHTSSFTGIVDHKTVRAFNDRQRHQEVTEYDRIKRARVVVKTIYKHLAQ